MYPNASVTSTRGAHQPAKETCAARQRCEVPTDDRVRDGRARHRFARGAGRHADGAHPGLDRAPEDAQARPPQSPRPAAARWPASSAVAVPGPDRHQPLPVTDRATRPAPVANQTTAAGRHAPTAPPEPGPLGARGGRYGFRSSVVAPGGRGFPPSPGRFHRRPARSPAPRRAPGPSSEETSLPDTHELPGAITTTATIDNGAAGTREVRFETGRLARQAAGAAVAYLGDSMVLAATTASKNPKEQLDFFPLTVDVEERMYAAGRIPGSFFRREGRPSEDAILTCRLIDRPLRPSFAKGLRNEIQVVCTILALDPDTLYDVVAINAASASTMLAGLPFSGPIGATRMGYVDGTWVAFPTHAELERATFDMVVAGRVLDGADGPATGDVAIMMVEAEAPPGTVALVAGGAAAPTEDVVAAGLEAAKPTVKALCAAQIELARQAAKPVANYPRFLDYQDGVLEALTGAVSAELAAALTIAGKPEREAELDRVKGLAKEKLAADFAGREREISGAFRALTKKLVRQRVIRDRVRIDGRGLVDIRQLSAEVEVVPRVHGSALFERGETQILGVTTLNMLRMEQQLDTLSPETRKRYMHNYNFPPYSTGETGRVGSPKRREIGHGALAERALMPVLPTREEFPYAIRQVSEALGSNGSTSMGSVCASTLALLNAGVPLRAPVAGIAMGLMSDTIDGETRFAALTVDGVA